MILDVFDNNFIRIANITKYSYAQYEDKLNSTGSFELKMALTTDGIELIKQTSYILFESDILGQVTSVNISRNEQQARQEIDITGKLIKRFLSYRCFIRSKNYTGTVSSVLRQFVTDNFIAPSDSKRKISSITLSTDAEYNPSSDNLTIQETGGSVEEALQSICDAHEMGYDLVPLVSNASNGNDISTNISRFDFRVIKGKDKTIGNIEGNTPVVFSFDLRNLISSQYIKDIVALKDMAYVAGEGEGTARTVIEVGSNTLTGLGRKELYVDARDLQSTDENGNALTTDQYTSTLQARGKEKLAENVINETFTASVNTYTVQFVYGTDYKKGDIVTIYDKGLDLTISARVTAVAATSLGNKELLDITFGYQKLTAVQKLKRGGIL